MRALVSSRHAPRLRRRRSAMLVSAVLELLLSALYAPVMMLIQTQHVIHILHRQRLGLGLAAPPGRSDLAGAKRGTFTGSHTAVGTC